MEDYDPFCAGEDDLKSPVESKSLRSNQPRFSPIQAASPTTPPITFANPKPVSFSALQPKAFPNPRVPSPAYSFPTAFGAPPPTSGMLFLFAFLRSNNSLNRLAPMAELSKDEKIELFKEALRLQVCCAVEVKAFLIAQGVTVTMGVDEALNLVKHTKEWNLLKFSEKKAAYASYLHSLKLQVWLLPPLLSSHTLLNIRKRKKKCKKLISCRKNLFNFSPNANLRRRHHFGMFLLFVDLNKYTVLLIS
jgi:hypothetical protein